MRDLYPNFHSPEHGHGAVHVPPWWMLTPAYTVLPFIRYPLGYDIVKPQFTVVPALGLVFFSYVLGALLPLAGPGFLWLPAFAVTSFLLSTAIFIKRFRGILRENIHSADAAYSFLTNLTTLPPFLCELFLVPAALAALGLLIANTFSFLLGGYLVVSAGSYIIMARWEESNHRRADIEVGNDLLRAAIFGKRMTRREKTERQADTAGPQPGYGTNSGPDEAELGQHPGGDQREPQGAPDVTVWGHGDNFTPDFMVWFGRNKKGDRQ